MFKSKKNYYNSFVSDINPWEKSAKNDFVLSGQHLGLQVNWKWKHVWVSWLKWLLCLDYSRFFWVNRILKWFFWRNIVMFIRERFFLRVFFASSSGVHLFKEWLRKLLIFIKRMSASLWVSESKLVALGIP